MSNEKENTKNILERITPEIKKEMESIWFGADFHHGHPKIVEICNRPVYVPLQVPENFTRTLKDLTYKQLLDTAHNEWLVKDVINKWVKKKDTFFIVGDLSMAKRADAEKFLDRLNGNKFLVIGNHDKNIDNSTRFSQTTLRKDFNFSRPGINIHIVLDHFPLASWNRKVHGAWHLYGHVHGRYKNPGLSMDIGIDNQELLDFTGGVHRPLNLFEVVTIMEAKRKFIGDELARAEYGVY